MNTNKWKKSVIHLECAGNSEEYYQGLEEWNEKMRNFRIGNLEEDPFFEQGDLEARTARFYGTAIFLLHQGRHYLLTARHVLNDKLAVTYLYDQRYNYAGMDFPITEEELEELQKKEQGDSIFPVIFTVPSLESYFDGKVGVQRKFLMNLGAGTYDRRPYSYDEVHDLAIICIDDHGKNFSNQLYEFGYEPIGIEDFSTGFFEEGSDVFTVGYPIAVSNIENIGLEEAQKYWSSDSVSIPVFSFGKISANNVNLGYLWMDLNVSPGNSGGPVICDNKLIGVLTHQAKGFVFSDEDEIEHQFAVGIPFARGTKVSFVIDLLNEQIKKDERRDGI